MLCRFVDKTIQRFGNGSGLVEIEDLAARKTASVENMIYSLDELYHGFCCLA